MTNKLEDFEGKYTKKYVKENIVKANTGKKPQWILKGFPLAVSLKCMFIKEIFETIIIVKIFHAYNSYKLLSVIIL